MGVAGSGKSTVGRALADRLGWDFAEGDDLHPAANIAKMAAGHPLSDADRAPWLALVRDWIDSRVQAGRPGVITCSALKRSYRDVLRDEHVVFVHLSATREQLLPRLVARTGHFMPAALLDSQLADLEPPDDGEQAITVDATLSVDRQVSQILEVVRPSPAGGPV
jgi:carbohydrate kinase (thermoresistant glucokinase family)